MTHFHRIKKIAQDHHRLAADSFHLTHRHAKRLLRKHRVVVHKVPRHPVQTATVASVSAVLLAGPVLAASVPEATPAANKAQQLQKELIADHVEASGSATTFAQVAQKPLNFGPTGSEVAVAKVPVQERIEQIVNADQKVFS